MEIGAPRVSAVEQSALLLNSCHHISKEMKNSTVTLITLHRGGDQTPQDFNYGVQRQAAPRRLQPRPGNHLSLRNKHPQPLDLSSATLVLP